MRIVYKSIARILQHIHHPMRVCIYLFTLGAIYILLDLLEPIVAGKIMDAVFSLQAESDIWILVIVWLIIFILKYAVSYGKMTCGLSIMLKTMKGIQLSFFRRILSAPLSFFDKYSVGYLMSRQTDDVFNLEGMMVHHLIDGLLAILEVLIIFICMFQIHVWLGISAVLLKMIDVFSNFYFPLKRLYKEHNEARAQTSSELQDVLKNIILIKAAGKESFEESYFDSYLKRYYETWNRRDKVNAIRSLLTRLSEDASYMMIIIIGGIFLYQRAITIGEMTAFLLFYRKLSSAFVGAVPLIPLFKIAEGAMERLDDLTNEIPVSESVNGNEKVPVIQQGLTIKDIRFGYNEKTVLSEVSMSCKPGQITAIVGKSGAGKSTLVNLLLGFYQPQRGQICIDGVDIRCFKGSDIRKMISYLPQDAPLFHRSFGENILYEASPNITKAEIQRAIQQSSAEGIERRFQSSEKAMTDLGRNLSGGERQRISLARELLKNGQIFIFDEATSAIDTETERVIQQTIESLAKDKIVIVIAHRLSTVMQANQIYVLDNGKIVETGTNDTLMKKQGVYYRLFSEQVKRNEKI